MQNIKRIVLLIISIMWMGLGSSYGAVTFDWITVGDAGNAGNVESQGTFGAVSDTYRIAKYEVTNAQYAEFLNAVAASDPNGLFNTTTDTRYHIERSGTDGSYSYTVESGWEANPVNYVSFFDTMRFSNWLENGQGSGDTESGVYSIGSGTDEVRAGGASFFLPSEDEWYKAAYYTGTGYTLYPTGNSLPAAGTDANYGSAVGDTWDVGTGTDENYGTFDMGGNLFEWNEAVIGSVRGSRGGAWNFPLHFLSSTLQNGGSPSVESDYTGFRVASAFSMSSSATPEPSSFLLMLCGVGLVRLLRSREGKSTPVPQRVLFRRRRSLY